MLINVKVSPKARANSVEKITQNSFRVKTSAPAEKNQANIAVIKLLAAYFQIKKSQIHLLAGKTSREKVFEVLDWD